MIAAPPSVRLPRVDYRALANFRYEIRRFLRVSEEAARQEGLEPLHHQLLLALKGLPAGTAPTISLLAERLQMHHHSAVGLVNRLVRRGLVARARDPSDHRRVLIHLTESGETILHRLSLFHQDELRSRARTLVSTLVAILRVPHTHS